MRKHPARIAVIHWVDAQLANEHSWYSPQQVEEFAEDRAACAVSVGIYLGKINGFHLITTSAIGDGQLMPPFKIPAGMVKRIRFIRL